MKFTWDRCNKSKSLPMGDRAWANISRREHPYGKSDQWDWCGSTCVGNWLRYESGDRGLERTAGEPIKHYHACAYVFRPTLAGSSSISLGYGWFHTPEEAESFIASKVSEYAEKACELVNA